MRRCAVPLLRCNAVARKQTPADEPGEQPARPAVVKLTTTITEEADAHIRRVIFEARGNSQAWWEAMSEWLIAHPEVIDEVTQAMTAKLGGRRRR